MLLLGDQLSKFWIINNLTVGESLDIIPGIFSLTYVQNPGAAFGILQGRLWLFLIMALLVVMLMVWYNARYSPASIIRVCLGLIVGGAVGNLIDRWNYGSVVDFFSIGWWPVFNIADIGIVCGGIILLIYVFINDRKEAF